MAGIDATRLALRHPTAALIVAVAVTLIAACTGTAHPASSPGVPQPLSKASTTSGPRRALVLSGGGPTGRAFEIGILKGLRDAGVDLTQADLIVGTSMGAVLGSQMRAGQTLDSLYDRLLAQATSPAGTSTDPGFDPTYFRQTMLMINGATEVTPQFRVEVASRALAAPEAIGQQAWLQFIDGDTGPLVHAWPSRPLKVAAIDVSDGTVRFFDSTQNVPIELALAATTAVPGRVAPITVGDRRYMDGFTGGPCPTGCWPYLDAAAGYGVIVAVTTGPGATAVAELADHMRSQGSRVVVISPDAESAAARGLDVFDLSRTGPTAQAARRQATTVAAEVRDVWNQAPPSGQ
jgi:NTE family protein